MIRIAHGVGLPAEIRFRLVEALLTDWYTGEDYITMHMLALTEIVIDMVDEVLINDLERMGLTGIHIRYMGYR